MNLAGLSRQLDWWNFPSMLHLIGMLAFLARNRSPRCHSRLQGMGR